MASNHGGEHVKERRGLFSLIYVEDIAYPCVVITMGLCSPRPRPNHVNTIKFLGTVRVATSQLPNHEQGTRGRIICKNLAPCKPHTGSAVIIKARPSTLTMDYKKKS